NCQMMQTQQVTPELRQWILAQASAGQPPDAVLKSMIDSGWQEAVAVVALEETLRGFLVDHAKANNLPMPVVVPEPLMMAGEVVVRAGEREVQILTSMRSPRVVVFGGLLSHGECDEIVDLAAKRLARSETVQVAMDPSE